MIFWVVYKRWYSDSKNTIGVIILIEIIFVTVKNMLLNDGDDNWNSTAILCVYEKQPLIGAVHELIVEFRDDILTIFP